MDRSTTFGNLWTGPPSINQIDTYFQHLGVNGPMKLLVVSVVVALFKLKSGSAITTVEHQLNVRAWTRKPFSVIRKLVVSTDEKQMFQRY